MWGPTQPGYADHVAVHKIIYFLKKLSMSDQFFFYYIYSAIVIG
jgi:hypothetical protein